jgi:hypothetical protein
MYPIATIAKKAGASWAALSESDAETSNTIAPPRAHQPRAVLEREVMPPS